MDKSLTHKHTHTVAQPYYFFITENGFVAFYLRPVAEIISLFP